MIRFERVFLGAVGILAAVLVGQELLALHVNVVQALILAVTAGRVFSVFEDSIFLSIEKQDKKRKKQEEKALRASLAKNTATPAKK
jgi:hypothetical protein